MRKVYTFFMILLLPLLLVRLAIKGIKQTGYWQHWYERIGFYYRPAPTQPSLWIHAVSLGETIAITPLIEYLLMHYPQFALVITTTTATGAQRVADRFGSQVFHYHFPYDIPWIVKRFLRYIQPKLAIFVETELWWNMFYACSRQNIPILIANARLSPKSFYRYAKFPRFTYSLLSHVSLVAAQSKSDARRFHKLGMPSAQISVVGNLKFALDKPYQLKERATSLKKAWKISSRPVWIAASTHEGEEIIILEAFKELKKRLPNILLILVPRHPERFMRVRTLCQSQNFKTEQRTQITTLNKNVDILIGDTVGELLLLYAIADVAFVGGSLIESGGHNILEPASVGLVSLTGPFMFNFRDIQRRCHKAQLTYVVHNAQALVEEVERFLRDDSLRQAVAARAEEFLVQHQESIHKHIEYVAQLLSFTT